MGEVGDDKLLVELRPHAGIPDGNSQGHLGAVHSPLGNKDAPSCETSHLKSYLGFRMSTKVSVGAAAYHSENLCSQVSFKMAALNA